MNHISTVIPTKSHYLLKGPWVTLNHFSLCFSVQFKAILLPFLFLQMRLDDLIWSEREGKKQEREEILNKRKGLSQKLISKEDFSAWLTSFFFSFCDFSTRANTALSPDNCFTSTRVWCGAAVKWKAVQMCYYLNFMIVYIFNVWPLKTIH